jgi:pyruvate,orthophosphate dikinase
MPNRFVYYFGNGHADGGREDKALLGGKGANLAEPTRTTSACTETRASL